MNVPVVPHDIDSVCDVWQSRGQSWVTLTLCCEWVIDIALYMCKMVILAWNSGVTLDWTCNKYAVSDDMQLRVNIHLYSILTILTTKIQRKYLCKWSKNIHDMIWIWWIIINNALSVYRLNSEIPVSVSDAKLWEMTGREIDCAGCWSLCHSFL